MNFFFTIIVEKPLRSSNQEICAYIIDILNFWCQEREKKKEREREREREKRKNK